MKIIIQAGGMGTRMQHLTSLKPKSLVAVNYLPVIFHLFKKYPHHEFVIIGDYKFEALDAYLTTFAKDVNYILLKSKETGNAAGIKEALTYIDPQEPVMIIWSDLVLPQDLEIDPTIEGCQVGVVDFPCGWRFENGEFKKGAAGGHNNGVAGVYIFNNKGSLKDFPTQGSIMKWLVKQPLKFTALPLTGCVDVGTLEAHSKVETNANRCRPFNRIEVVDGKIVKTGVTQEAQKLIEREIVWYKQMSAWGYPNIPQVLGTKPLTLEKIDGDNLFCLHVKDEDKSKVLTNIVDTIKLMHGYAKVEASAWDLYKEYFQKTIMRLISVQSAIPLVEEEYININGHKCLNILRSPHVLREAVIKTLMDIRSYCPIHGDAQLTNTMMDKKGRIFFIDPRGYFGNSEVYGDPRYDWAKIYYSLKGNFDQFNIKNFTAEIKDRVTFKIGSNGWEGSVDDFLNLIPRTEASPKEIELIHAIIWLSLASQAWEDYDSMCVAFYNGLLKFHEWQNTYGREV